MSLTRWTAGYLLLMALGPVVPQLRPQHKIPRSETLDYLIETKKYDKQFPPEFDYEKPTVIECQIIVDSIDSVNEGTMDFTVSTFLYQRWTEHRLRFHKLVENTTYLELDANSIAKVWLPDLYFPNEKKATFHEVTMANRMLRIYDDGAIMYTLRISLTLSCSMDLRSFPFDKQVCPIQLASFSYTDAKLLLKWSGEGAVDISKNVALTQFQVLKVTNTNCTDFLRQKGNHSCLEANFHLTRNIGYYVVQMYIPTILIVVLSWVSFWLNVNSVPGRISLGVLTVLTMTTQISSVNASLPRVSYTKAIDIWMATCLLFVFTALIEFAVANVFSQQETMSGFFFRNPCCIDDPEKDAATVTTTRREVYMSTDGTTTKKENSPKRKMHKGQWYAAFLDGASRILFPVLFALFNMVYWLSFLSDS